MYRLRVRQVAGRIRLLAEERSRERIKIARDLHDTLLQGIHGLTLRFHYSAQKVSDSAERAALENALESADKILDEGGERVRHLRTSPLPAATLPGSISLIGEVAFCVSVQGTPHALRAVEEDEVFCIAREALTNAFEHANALKISITIAYGDSYFRLSCRDDGQGIEVGTLKEGSVGLWGLQGMRERVKHVGARFETRSSAGLGTEISIVLPSARAYEGTSCWGRLKTNG